MRPRITLQRAATLAFIILFIAINAIGLWIRITNDGMGPLDMRTDFTADFTRASLKSYESSGAINIYRWWFIPVDFIFIVSYVMAGTFLVRRLRPRLRALIFLPLFIGIADVSENITELLLMQTGFIPGTFIALTLFTLVKDVGLIMLLAWLAVRGAQVILTARQRRIVASIR